MTALAIVLLVVLSNVFTGVLCTIYGRRLEQKFVATTLAEFSRGDAAAKAAVEGIRKRFLLLGSGLEAYLRKYL